MTTSQTQQSFDFAIIGAGVVGTAIARELTQYTSSVVLIDSLDDVGAGTSKANTAILHTGFDMKPGTLESRLVSQGYKLLLEFARKSSISVEETGAILVAWNEAEVAELEHIQARAVENGYLKTQLISSQEIYDREPHLGRGALAGLEVPDEFIIDPWSVSVAFATQAKIRGAEVRLNSEVTSVSEENGAYSLTTTSGVIKTKFVINAAGLYSDWIDTLFGFNDLVITPRRGELIVFDKLSRKLVNHIILPVPTKMGKGVLISPTIFGNVMLGPTAVDVTDKNDKSVTEAGIEFLLEKGRKLSPALLKEEITTMYAGLRAASNQTDYMIKKHENASVITVGGIRSTGLTASMAIAQYVLSLIKKDTLLNARFNVHDPIKMPVLGEAFLRPYQDENLIATRSSYGEIVCHCERVSKGEIEDAMNSLLPPSSLSGLSRRTRACLGRCQGFYCSAEVKEMLAEFSPSNNHVRNSL